jgi:hypothetical protein
MMLKLSIKLTTNATSKHALALSEYTMNTSVNTPSSIVCVILEKKISFVKNAGIGFFSNGKTLTIAKNCMPSDTFITTSNTPFIF